jgi:HD superfamily phosphohydrolase
MRIGQKIVCTNSTINQERIVQNMYLSDNIICYNNHRITSVESGLGSYYIFTI